MSGEGHVEQEACRARDMSGKGFARRGACWARGVLGKGHIGRGACRARGVSGEGRVGRGLRHVWEHWHVGACWRVGRRHVETLRVSVWERLSMGGPEPACEGAGMLVQWCVRGRGAQLTWHNTSRRNGEKITWQL